MNKKQIIGKSGEIKACEFLKNKKYKIIDINFLCRSGEIDIIALSPYKELVFIEVKTRSNINYGMPSEAVTKKKIKNIKASAKYYLFKNRINNVDIRFDVIEILFINSRVLINHIENAF